MAETTPTMPWARGTAGRGRPRDGSITLRVLGAASALVAERGRHRVGIDDVAARAGVSKPAIYRRWPSKEALLADVLSAEPPRLSGADPGLPEGSIRAQLLLVLRRLLEHDDQLEPVTSHLTTQLDEEVAQAFEARYIEPRRADLRALLAAGIEAGQIRADLDVEVAIDLVFATAVFYDLRRFQRPGLALDADDLTERVIDSLLGGFAVPVPARPVGRRTR